MKITNIGWMALFFVAVYFLFWKEDSRAANATILNRSADREAHTKLRGEKWEDEILYLVIHSTANDSSYADANFHDHYLDTTSRKVSWHYNVDSKQIIQSRHDSLMCLHASSPLVNSQSIGIEVCQNKGWDEKSTTVNLLELIAVLKQRYPGVKVIFHDEVKILDKKAKIHNKICPAVFNEAERQMIKAGEYR